MTGEIFSTESFLWSCFWQSTIFLMAGLLGSFLFRRHSARAHRVLFLAMIAAVVVPAASILVKHYELGVFAAEPTVIQPATENRAIHEATGIISNEAIERSPFPINEDLHSAMAISGAAKFPWRSALLYAWMAASLTLAARLLVTFALGVRLLGRALPLDCEKMEQAVCSARAKLGIDREVEVCSSQGVRSPVIWCWRRKPVLLVPDAAGRSDNGVDWTGVLCHELAHWKRLDHISGLLAELAGCILPWHLLLWWAKSRLISLSEQACDDWVVATGQPGTDYAESLLDLTPGRQMAFVPAVVSSKRELAGRIQRILKDSCGNPRTGAVWALAACIVAGCIAIGVAFAQTRPAEPVVAEEELLTASPAGVDDSRSRTKLNKILDAMLYHDKSAMPIAMHVEIKMYDLRKPADSAHRQTYSFEQRLDGRRLDSAMTVYRFEDGKRSRTQENRRVFTGSQYVYRQQTGGSLHVSLEPADEAKRIMAYYHLWGGVLLGHLDGDRKPVAAILKDSPAVALQDQMEAVGDFLCYVIEGKTDRGSYKIWVDPEHDYRIRRSVVDKGPGDMWFGKPIPKDPPEDGSTTATTHMEISDVKLERIGNHFIPTAETMTSTMIRTDGSKYRDQMVVTRSQIDLHPDFEKLGAFMMDGVSDGTRVGNSDPQSYGYEYEFRDGKVVPIGDGGTILGRLELSGDFGMDTVLADNKLSFYASIRPTQTTENETERRRQHSIRLYPTEDGSFRIENPPPGRHLLNVRLTRLTVKDMPSDRRRLYTIEIGSVDREFSIPEKADGADYETVDLGVLKMAISGTQGQKDNPSDKTDGATSHRASLIGRRLTEFEGIDIDFMPEQAKDRMILICFWDMNQRPSRNCLLQLEKRAKEMEREGVTVIAVQASEVDKNSLNEWVNENGIPFPVGMVQSNEEKTRFTWGIMSLPWLVLTDRQHIVRDVGFGIDVLDTKLADADEPITKEEIEKGRRSVAESEIERLGGTIVKVSENDVDYTEVSLNGPRYRRQWKGGDWGARYLNDLANVRKLRIQDVNTFTNEGMEHLRGLRRLESLMLIRTGVSDDGLVHLKGLVNLEFLSLWSNKFTDAGLEQITEMTELKSLRLDDAQITNEGLRKLKQSGLLTRLEFLSLSRTQITDAGLAHLQGMDKLKRLYLHETKISDKGISNLAQLSSLEVLGLSKTNITDAGLAHLKGLENLNMLYLSNTQITDTGLEHLKESANLVQLWLGSTGITDDGLIHIQGLTKLQSVSLERTRVTDKGLAYLKSRTALSELFLQQSDVTIDGYLDLKGALPDCQIYWEEKKNNDSSSTKETASADLGKVDGLVKDPQDQPVPGASVTLFQTKLEYVTDAEGKFVATLALSDEMRYFFAVHKQRKLVASGRLAAGKRHLEIKLVPAKIVSGRVLDPNGRPVSGAQVAPLPMTCFHVLTDIKGRFDVGWSPEWAGDLKEFSLLARHQELNLAGVVEITESARTANIELEPALALTGTVEDPNGTPIPEARVSISLNRSRWGAGTPVEAVVTDDQGRFELPALPQRQEYGVSAEAEGYWRNGIKTGVINRVTGREEVGPIILKKPILSVSGTVVDGNGNAVANIPVYWRGEGQPPRESQTDTHGKFSFDEVCRGSAKINAKNETLFGTVETQGGAKDVRLVVGPRFGPGTAEKIGLAQQRVISFPEDRSMGKLFVRDTGSDSWYEGWQELAEAKGDVSVAAGKEVKLQISEQAAGDLSALDKLGTDDLQMLSFGWKAVQVGSLAPIGNLKGLKALNIQSAKFDCEDFKHLTGLAQLEVLRFGDQKLTDGSMRYVGQLTSLRSLALWGTGISDEGLGHLKNLTNLTFLALNECEITDEGLEHLSNMTAIEGLQLRRTKITDKGLRKLQGFDRLKHIELGSNRLTDEGLKHLENLTSLENIWLDSNPITDKGLSYLAGMKNLKELYAGRTEITDAGLVNLKGMKEFHHLLISGIGDEGIRHLSELQALEMLQIQDAQVTKASIPDFKKMMSAKQVLLSGDKINDDLLDALRTALPNCKIWDPQRSRDYPMPEWRKRFEAVYRLEDGQILKRISPPFIPERRDYYLNEHSSQAKDISRSPDRFTFHWPGKLKDWGLAFARTDIKSTLRGVLRLKSYEFEGPRELLDLNLPGDWIVRDEAPVAAKLAALQEVLANELERKIRFEKRTVEHEVIVATGRFSFHPLAEARKQDAVHLYVDELSSSGGGTVDSVAELLQTIGNRANTYVVDRTESAEETPIFYYLHRSSRPLRQMESSPEKTEKLKVFLANITKQTELQFELGSQPAEVWFVTEEKEN